MGIQQGILSGRPIVSRGLGVQRGLLASAALNVAKLFADAVGKMQIDNGDNMFSDVYGTTPAGYGDPVMLQLDTSQGAGWNGSEFAGLGPELVSAPSSVGEDWIDNGDGTYTATESESLNLLRFDGIGIEADKFYLLTVRAKDATTGNLYVKLNGSAQPIVSNNGLSRRLVKGVANDGSQIVASSGYDGTVTEFSVRELPGHHDQQPTVPAAQIKTRWPKAGRRNLLTWTEDLSNAVWGKGRSVVSPDLGGPSGDHQAWEIRDNASGGSNAAYVDQPMVLASATNYSASIYAKAGTLSQVALGSVAIDVDGLSFFDLASGSLISRAAAHSSATMEDVGDGWYRCTVVFQSTTDLNGFFRVYLAVGGSAFVTLNGTNTILLSAGQLETGSAATPYQKVTNPYDITEAGQRDCVGLYGGGASDPRWSVTPPIDFTGTDKMTVIAGVTKLSDAAFGAIISQGDATTDNGAWELAASTNAGDTPARRTYRSQLYNGSASFEAYGLFAAPTTNVISTGFDFSAPTAVFPTDIDGVDAPILEVSRNASVRAGFLNAPIHSGARKGVGSFFNGYIWGQLIVGKELDPAALAKAEALIAYHTPGVTL